MHRHVQKKCICYIPDIPYTIETSHTLQRWGSTILDLAAFFFLSIFPIIRSIQVQHHNDTLWHQQACLCIQTIDRGWAKSKYRYGTQSGLRFPYSDIRLRFPYSDIRAACQERDVTCSTDPEQPVSQIKPGSYTWVVWHSHPDGILELKNCGTASSSVVSGQYLCIPICTI